MATAILNNDPDVLWIRLRTALREGRLTDAAEAQQQLAEAGIVITIKGLAVAKQSPRQEGTPCK